MKKSNGFKESFCFAVQGILYTIRHERNMKVHLIAAALVFILAFFLKVENWELLILTIAVTMVITAEMINTSIENVVDLYCKDQINPLAKIAKDAAAGAVLFNVLGACVAGYIILFRKIISFLF